MAGRQGPEAEAGGTAHRVREAPRKFSYQSLRATNGQRRRGHGPLDRFPGKYGASPDGLVVDRATGEAGLLEVKCLWSRRHKRQLAPLTKCPNRYFAQIQGQMEVCDREWCDLVLWVPHDVRVLRVPRDRAFGVTSWARRSPRFRKSRRCARKSTALSCVCGKNQRRCGRAPQGRPGGGAARAAEISSSSADHLRRAADGLVNSGRLQTSCLDKEEASKHHGQRSTRRP